MSSLHPHPKMIGVVLALHIVGYCFLTFAFLLDLMKIFRNIYHTGLW